MPLREILKEMMLAQIISYHFFVKLAMVNYQKCLCTVTNEHFIMIDQGYY